MSIKHRKAARRPRAATPQDRSIWKSLFSALPIALCSGLLLLLLLALLLLTTEDPGRFGGMGGIAMLYLTALIGGMTCARIHGRRAPLLCGLGMGGLLLLLFTALSLLLPDTLYKNEAKALLIRAPILPVAVLGALWASRRSRSRTKRGRR